MVGVFQLPDDTKGPKLWWFSSDLLENETFCQQVALICENFDKSALLSWETAKLKFQSIAQQHTCFRIKQKKHEISSLKSMLTQINKRIYNGEDLELDRLAVEQCLENCHDSLHFSSENTDWIIWEGKPNKHFLHIEDLKRTQHLSSLLDKSGHEMMNIDEILQILYEFYSELYSQDKDQNSLEEIQSFLSLITSLPKLLSCVDTLAGPNTEKEVENAIKRL